MDDSETYMNMKRTYTGSGAPSRDDLTCTDTDLNIRKVERLTNRQADDLDPTYSQLNFHQNEIPIAKEENPPMAPRPGEMPTTAQADDLDPTYSRLNLLQNELPIANEEDPPVASGPGEMSVTAQADGLNSTYTVLKLPNDELITEEYEDPPIAPGPAEMSVVAQTGPHKEQTNENIGNRPDRKFCLLCLVTFVLFATVVGLSIHVSQIRQSQITPDRNYYELNSTLQSKISENTHLNFSRRTCLKNLSALNSNLSDLNRMHSDLRHKFTEMETKYRSANEIMARICELLTSRRVPACPQGWIEHEGRCYFLSILEESYDGSREHCSNFDARLLEIGSKQEEEFVSTSIGEVYQTYWIGKCRYGNVDSNLLRKSYSRSSCSKCNAYRGYNPCKSKRRFICEKSAHLYPDIPAEIRGLCQHPEGKT
ncbi:C-type lectin domain family 17, member A-like [Hypanus sabinus]|uniref:C-type lectin domain family 17, member A-like n=1 Tax=Hypanus sabinus TaxID=79690 RepID=UPI0028C454B3|nr:C-type lectin domain family 17, member A-like [Hypanus sabinus]